MRSQLRDDFDPDTIARKARDLGNAQVEVKGQGILARGGMARLSDAGGVSFPRSALCGILQRQRDRPRADHRQCGPLDTVGRPVTPRAGRSARPRISMTEPFPARMQRAVRSRPWDHAVS